MEKDHLGLRIREAMSPASARSVARTAGISDSTLRSILAGSRPTVDNLVALARALDVSLEWLATGSGPRSAHPQGGTRIPLYETIDALAAASPPADTLELPHAFVSSRLGCDTADLAAMAIASNAMAPTLCDGDLALVDISAERIARDDIYVFTFEAVAHLRRVQRSGARLIIQADNPVYSAWTIAATHTTGVRVAGRVVGTIRRP